MGTQMHRTSLFRDVTVRWVAILWIAFSFSGACTAAAQSLDLYVATNGNDSWSGRVASPTGKGSEGPFATLECARDEIRKLKRDGVRRPFTVWVRGGTYWIPQTFSLTADDSGTAEAPVVYQSYGKEKPVLIGGRPITGFHPYRNAILKADVGAQGFRGIYFRQLFFNDHRQIIARYPNFDPEHAYTGGYAYVAGKPIPMFVARSDDSRNQLQYKVSDARTWAHPADGEVIIFPRFNWINQELPIVSVNRETRTITLGKDAKYAIRPLDRYYVRNLFEELDWPGEWWLDRKTWTLYFWPPSPIAGATIYAPTTGNLIEIEPGAAWITIRGFTLEGADSSAVLVRDCLNCLIAGNRIRNIGGRLGSNSEPGIQSGAGIRIDGGKNCGVVGNDIYDVDNNGIALSGGSRDTLEPAGHYADNNYIHHIGILNGHGSGIYLDGVGLRVSHNLIHDTTRLGIFAGCADCMIEYNHIRDTNLETEDTGGIYLYGMGWSNRGNVIRYNFIEDTLGYGRRENMWISPYFSSAIYLDETASGVQVYGNILVRAPLGGVKMHGGRDNVIENNIIVDGDICQVDFSVLAKGSQADQLKQFSKYRANPAYKKYGNWAASDPQTMLRMQGDKFLRNIVLYKENRLNALNWPLPPPSSPQPSKIFLQSGAENIDIQDSDYNVIWHDGLPLDVDLPNVPHDKQWQQWRKKGMDTHSIIADPGFMDAAHDDYRLRPDSPALRLGFVPIPIHKIGPYASPLRAHWPIVEASGVREKPLPSITPVKNP